MYWLKVSRQTVVHQFQLSPSLYPCMCADVVGPGPTRGRGIAVGATHHGTEEGTVLNSGLHTAVVALVQQCS